VEIDFPDYVEFKEKGDFERSHAFYYMPYVGVSYFELNQIGISTLSEFAPSVKLAGNIDFYLPT
jgi:hypothetical protein